MLDAYPLAKTAHWMDLVWNNRWYGKEITELAIVPEWDVEGMDYSMAIEALLRRDRLREWAPVPDPADSRDSIPVRK